MNKFFLGIMQTVIAAGIVAIFTVLWSINTRITVLEAHTCSCDRTSHVATIKP